MVNSNAPSIDPKCEITRLQQMMNRMSCSRISSASSVNQQFSLQDYAVQQELGKGAYGNVYCVRCKRDNKDYALKQILLPSSREGLPQSTLREITVMRHLSKKSHPNIVSLKAVFHQLEPSRGVLRINMIMEKCDWDLHTFIREVPRAVPEHQVRHIAAQIVKGLDFLHMNNVIHRDLKPQNILLNRDQSVKLADFGLSKQHSNTTAFTTLVVTLWYRAPEVLLQSYYTSSIDMWALGCIVSEIYSRSALFAGQSEAEQLTDIFRKIGTPIGKEWPAESVVSRNSFPVFPKRNTKEINPRMSSEAADFVSQCLSFEPLKRLSARNALGHPFLQPPRVCRVLKVSDGY